MLNKIIFAIDNNHDLRTVARFMRQMDTCRAMNILKGSFVSCIGMYKGVLEPSYMMDEKDFRDVVQKTHYLLKQESILHVPADTRQPCTLEYLEDGVPDVTIESMREVSPALAMTLSSWTYVIETNKYFSTE